MRAGFLIVCAVFLASCLPVLVCVCVCVFGFLVSVFVGLVFVRFS